MPVQELGSAPSEAARSRRARSRIDDVPSGRHGLLVPGLEALQFGDEVRGAEPRVERGEPLGGLGADVLLALPENIRRAPRTDFASCSRPGDAVTGQFVDRARLMSGERRQVRVAARHGGDQVAIARSQVQHAPLRPGRRRGAAVGARERCGGLSAVVRRRCCRPLTSFAARFDPPADVRRRHP